MSTVRSTQVVQQTLETTDRTTNVLATQVVQQTLETANRTTNVLATQVVIQVLRTVTIGPDDTGPFKLVGSATCEY